ncbi:MAG TPA: FCD domain-containing protein [Actinocatenispora sp.]
MTTAESADRPRRATGSQELIRERMTSLILERGLRAGDPLPNEQELMSLLGVGRHPLREAMKALQAVGIVEIRHGFGTYVGAVGLQSLEDGLAFRMRQSMGGDLSDVRNVLEVREVLEVGLAAKVVAHFGRHGTDELADIVDRMRVRADAGEYFPDEDWAFHRALYQPLGNELVVGLVGVFWRAFAEVDTRLPGPRYTPADAFGWHRDLLDALRAGRPDRYAAAMTEHFVGIHGRLDD